jgi:predicted Zn finger-like uncharacterized protein
MLIVCPSCATSYSLTEAQLGRGRTLRCANCRHTWHATPADALEGAVSAAFAGATPHDHSFEPQTLAEPVPAGAGDSQDLAAGFDALEQAPPLPAPKSSRKARPARSAPASTLAARLRSARPWQMALVVAALALVAAAVEREPIVRHVPQTARLFAAVHLPVNLRGLALDEVRSEVIADKDQTILVVEGAIRNLRKGDTTVPPLTLSLRGTDGSELYSWIAESPHVVLAAGESTPFRTRMVAPPLDGRDVLVRFARIDDSAPAAH